MRDRRRGGPDLNAVPPGIFALVREPRADLAPRGGFILPYNLRYAEGTLSGGDSEALGRAYDRCCCRAGAR